MARSAKSPLEFVKNCALHIRVVPTPISFAERRSVLQVLEQHGPVEVFQKRPGWNNSFLSVTKEPTTATRLSSNSPLTYQISIPRTTVDVRNAGLGKPATIDTEPLIGHIATNTDPRAGTAQDGGAESTQEEKQFTLHIYPIDTKEHGDYQIRSPLRNQWPSKVDEKATESYMATMLKQSLPKDLAAKGFAQWLQDFGDSQLATPREDRLQARYCAPSIVKKSHEGAPP